MAYLTTFSESDATSPNVVCFMSNDSEIISHEGILLPSRYILALTDGVEENPRSLKSETVRVKAQI